MSPTDTMINYYKLLSDPSHAWLNDPLSPFRTPSGYDYKRIPCIYFKLRTFRSKPGPKSRLKVPVVERPSLRYLRDGKWARTQLACSASMSYKERFNYQMERLIKRWHEEAQSMGCDHLKPYILMEDDSLSELFHL